MQRTEVAFDFCLWVIYSRARLYKLCQSQGECWRSARASRYVLLSFWYVQWQIMKPGVLHEYVALVMSCIDCDVYFLSAYYDGIEASPCLGQTFHNNRQNPFSSSRFIPCKNRDGYSSMLPTLIPGMNNWHNTYRTDNWSFLTSTAEAVMNVLDVQI